MATGKGLERARRVDRLRKLFDLPADHAFPPRPGLPLGEDIPRPDQVLPRPLTPEDDARLQAGLFGRHDPLSSALLLTRWTGPRIGETVDLAADRLRHPGGDQWTLHVPLGKLHNERRTPVDERARTLVARLRFLRTLPPAAPPEFPLPRPQGRGALCARLRTALSDAARLLGLYRQQNPTVSDKPLQLLPRRLVRVRSRFQILVSRTETEK